MNVLLLSGAWPDYLQDVVYHGLVGALGHEHVAAYPAPERYHSQAPPDSPHPMLWFDLPRVPERSLSDWLDWADGVVIGSLRPGVAEVARAVLEAAPPIPIAYLDGEDDPYVRAVVRHVDVYCKRETLLPGVPSARLQLRRAHDRVRGRAPAGPLARRVGVARVGIPEVVPLPFGIIDVGYEPPAGPAEWDVAFVAGPTSAERRLVRDDLAGLQAEGLRVFAPEATGDRRLDWRAYLDALARSRIAISVRGDGFDTYRYWEIPYTGALLLSEPPAIAVPDDFVPDEEAAFAPPRRLAAAARALLASDTHAIAARGREKLLRAHTSVQRAERVLALLERAATPPRRRRPL